jgi:hypothetical protein
MNAWLINISTFWLNYVVSKIYTIKFILDYDSQQDQLFF